MSFEKKSTKIELGGAAIAAVTYIRQAIEVLSGEFVEFRDLQVNLGPINRMGVTDPDHLSILHRNVVVKGKFFLCPSLRFIDLSADFSLKKISRKDSAHTRWEIERSAAFALTPENEPAEWFCAWWTLKPAVSYPEVKVIRQVGGKGNAFSSGPENPTWCVGLDRACRHEEAYVPGV